MTSRSLLALLFVSLLACGGAAPPPAAHPVAMPPTSLRAATEAERDAARAAITAEHGEGCELLHVEAAGTPSRVLAIYAHADLPTAPNARQRVCGAEADPAPVTLRPSCRYLAIARLDGTRLDARLELGSWCDGDADAGTFEMYAGDFDADGRDEVSLMVGTRASYVFDVATFGVQLAAPGIDYQLEYPDGTRLARRGEVRDGSFEFEDGFDDPVMARMMNEGERLRPRRAEPMIEDETPFEFFAYDAAADCWHLPASTVETAGP